MNVASKLKAIAIVGLLLAASSVAGFAQTAVTQLPRTCVIGTQYLFTPPSGLTKLPAEALAPLLGITLQ